MDGAHEDRYNRLGDCEVCALESAHYTCPRCELKTCSLRCVEIHKKELECNGERDKTGYIPLSKFTNLTLLSDYRFLEDVSRAIDNSRRNPLKKYTRLNRTLPKHLFKLRMAALQRKTTLHFLPQHFTRHKENTTQLNFQSGIISWKLELVFPQGNNIKVTLERCSENDRVSFLLSKYVEFEKCPDLYRSHLKFYHSAGLSGLEVLLKAENVMNSNSFFLLEKSLTLKENLENRIIIENPILYVILRDHKYEYTVLDSDSQAQSTVDIDDRGKRNFKLFHYFDAISYTSNKTKSDQAAQSISSSFGELKKYFAVGDSDDSDIEQDSENIKVKTKPQKRAKICDFYIPDYNELVKQEL